ncbi:MAG: hypothetical protein ACHQUC_08860 [Chlamydiales bacterium]
MFIDKSIHYLLNTKNLFGYNYEKDDQRETLSQIPHYKKTEINSTAHYEFTRLEKFGNLLMAPLSFTVRKLSSKDLNFALVESLLVITFLFMVILAAPGFTAKCIGEKLNSNGDIYREARRLDFEIQNDMLDLSIIEHTLHEQCSSRALLTMLNPDRDYNFAMITGVENQPRLSPEQKQEIEKMMREVSTLRFNDGQGHLQIWLQKQFEITREEAASLVIGFAPERKKRLEKGQQTPEGTKFLDAAEALRKLSALFAERVNAANESEQAAVNARVNGMFIHSKNHVTGMFIFENYFSNKMIALAKSLQRIEKAVDDQGQWTLSSCVNEGKEWFIHQKVERYLAQFHAVVERLSTPS